MPSPAAWTVGGNLFLHGYTLLPEVALQNRSMLIVYVLNFGIMILSVAFVNPFLIAMHPFPFFFSRQN